MIYKPLSEESLFDIAVKLYKDFALGLKDLLTLNPEININGYTQVGVFDDTFDYTFGGTQAVALGNLEYTPGLTRKRPIIDVPFLAPTKNYQAHYLQSHFDLAVQLYGDFSQIGEILGNISDINGNIALGTAFVLPQQSDPIAKYFEKRIVATDFPATDPEALTVDATDITIDSDLVTVDQTMR